MMGKRSKATIRQKTIIATLLIIGIDLFFFYRVLNARSNVEHYMIVILAVFLNVFYFFYLRLNRLRISGNTKTSQKDYHEYLSFLVEDMDFLEPVNVESINQETEEAPLEETPEEGKETVEILRPEEVIHEEADFEQTVVPSDYCSDLTRYMSESGLSVDKNTIRAMFAAMAASKLVVITHENQEISERFVELFTEFVGAQFFSDEVTDDIKRFDDLFKPNHTFKKGINTSFSEVNTLNLLTLKEVDLKNINKYFDEVINYAMNPSLPFEVTNRNFKTDEPLPDNTWFMVIPKHFDASLLSKNLVKGCALLDLNAKPVNPKEKVYDTAVKLSYENMRDLLSEGYDEHFLEEVDWKKIDQIEKQFTLKHTHLVDNKLFRQLERYASAFLMFGGDNKEALDFMLSAKLLPLIYVMKAQKAIKGNEDILTLFEKLFGLEYLNKSKKLLKAIQTMNQA